MSRKREDGFYWVLEDSRIGWKVAEYRELESCECWLLPGTDLLLYDKDFEEIDERRVVRDE